MIAKKIYEHSRLHVDDDYPWNHARRWLNEAMSLIATLTNTGDIKEQFIIEADKAGYYDLPDNCIGIDGVFRNSVAKINKEDNYLEGAGDIYIPDAGTFIVVYKRVAKEIIRDSDTPEVNSLYHLPISYWLASREKLRFNSEDRDGIRLQQDFYAQIKAVDMKLSEKKRVRKIMI